MNSPNLTLSQKIAYALPAAPIAALSLPVLVYLPPFYESLGMSLTMVGLIFMLNRLWDVITDPVLGILSDRYPSRWGRRRHWIALSLPILIVSTYMLFLPPESVTAIYLGGWLFLLYIGYTLIVLSHSSWGVELSSDYHERSSIHGIREIAIIIGMISVLALPAFLDASVWEKGGEAISYAEKLAIMGFFIIVLLPLSSLISFISVGEKSTAPQRMEIKWREMYPQLLGSSALRRLLAGDILVGLSVGTTGSLYLYFYDSFFQLSQYASSLLLLYFASGCLAVPVWIKLSRRFEKHTLFSIACLYTALAAPLVLIVPKGSIVAGVITTFIYGVGSGAMPFLARSMMGDISDQHDLKTGVQQTGLFFSILSLTNKVGSAIAVGLVYLLLDMVGYVPHGENAMAATNSLALLFIGIPVICMCFSAYFMWSYPLGISEQQDCRDKIFARDGA